MMGASSFNVAVVFLATLVHLGVCADLLGYLFISTPRTGKVSYVRIPANGDLSGAKPITLIDKGLQHPQGLAIDHKRKRLFVADPDVQKIFVYQLKESGDTLSTDGRQTIVSDNAESRWVAVDGLGNVFFSDEPNSKILKITTARMVRGNTVPEVIYSPHNLTQGTSAEAQQTVNDGSEPGLVNHPGGVAVDNFHVFWTNKRMGTKDGTVVKGSEVVKDSGPDIRNNMAILAQNSPKSYGLCLALNNVFFTDSEKHIYGVKKTGGEVFEVSNKLKKPRGCVWDGDGTVFVADREQNAVFSFPGNMHRITHADVTKVLDIEDAFGLAFLSSARSRAWSFIALFAVLASILRD